MGKIVAIDCVKLQKGHGKSIGIYTFAVRLVQNLSLKMIDSRLIVLGNENNKKDFNIENVEFVCVKWANKNKLTWVMWELLGVRYYMKKYRVDKIIFPRGFAPLGSGRKCIIVVHDMIPFYYKEKFPDALNKVENMYIMHRLSTSIRSAEKVVTISEYSKKEIERIVPKALGRVTVILHGYDTVTIENTNSHIEGEYILGITSSLPHKNAVNIIQTYLEYRKLAEIPLKLVIIGIESIRPYEPTLDQVVYDDIICKRFLADSEFYGVFINAKCLLFLSLMEGYGFPPLEAMQLEIPVILSNRSSLPEVAGEAAILVDPQNPIKVAEELQKVLSDFQLQRSLVQRGKENLKRFSWEKQIEYYLRLLND